MKTVRLFTDKHLEKFGSIFETLYKDELLTDCTLCCKDGSIQVHKLILAASSSYFRNFFLQHGKEKTIFFMYKISYAQLKDFIELIYKGSINVPPDHFTALYDLAEELQVTGLLVDGLPTSTPASDAKYNGYGVDTRYKGQKRVVVDFVAENEGSSAAKIAKSTERLSNLDKSDKLKKDIDNGLTKDLENSENTSESSDDTNNTQERVKVKTEVIDIPQDDKNNLSAWARKERKFKCELCSSSFKRASHLTRHQLVHTGERPYACNQCDKAFSRHDKLKHHIHKAHELQSISECLPEDSLYTIGHIQFLSPEQSMFESPTAFITPQEETNDNLEVLKVCQENTASFPTKKKPRGRPRKYPIVTPPVGKRPRGRPRLKPAVPPPLVKRPRGRPRLNPIAASQTPQDRLNNDSYDITNMPYGDLQYLTKPVEDREASMNDMSLDEPHMIEPLVEIKMEPQEKLPTTKDDMRNTTFLENIGLFEKAIGKIGECTISVASNTNNDNSSSSENKPLD